MPSKTQDTDISDVILPKKKRRKTTALKNLFGGLVEEQKRNVPLQMSQKRLKMERIQSAGNIKLDLNEIEERVDE